MRFPIDTSELRFVVVAPAEPLRRYEEGRPREAWELRTDDDGRVLWRVPLVALGDGAGEVMKIRVADDPQLEPGETVQVKDLTAQTWRLDGRTGVTLRAGAITSNIAWIGSKGG
jgi:hypothetical protein